MQSKNRGFIHLSDIRNVSSSQAENAAWELIALFLCKGEYEAAPVGVIQI